MQVKCSLPVPDTMQIIVSQIAFQNIHSLILNQQVARKRIAMFQYDMICCWKPWPLEIRIRTIDSNQEISTPDKTHDDCLCEVGGFVLYVAIFLFLLFTGLARMQTCWLTLTLIGSYDAVSYSLRHLSRVTLITNFIWINPSRDYDLWARISENYYKRCCEKQSLFERRKCPYFLHCVKQIP